MVKEYFKSYINIKKYFVDVMKWTEKSKGMM